MLHKTCCVCCIKNATLFLSILFFHLPFSLWQLSPGQPAILFLDTRILDLDEDETAGEASARSRRPVIVARLSTQDHTNLEGDIGCSDMTLLIQNIDEQTVLSGGLRRT